MKYKLLLLYILIWLFGFSATAQTIGGKIGGIIRDAQGSPLGGATVTLLTANDSTITQTLVADKEGKFAFKALPKNIYIIAASFTGYIKYTSGQVNIDAVHTLITLPPIVLKQADKNMLRNVTVTTQKRLIEQKLDRTIVNVDAMLTAAGGTALDVLAQSPGVMVDMNGNISLNGKSSVVVLIDDRPTYMSAQNLADYLKSLPAGMLDKVELMSNPPAKYDASGSAVINIVLKKTGRLALMAMQVPVTTKAFMHGATQP